MPRVIGMPEEPEEELETKKDDGEVIAMREISASIRELQRQIQAGIAENKKNVTVSTGAMDALLKTMTELMRTNKPQPITVELPRKEPTRHVFNIQRDQEGKIAKVTVTEEKAK